MDLVPERQRQPGPLMFLTDDDDPPRPDNHTDKEKWEIDPKTRKSARILMAARSNCR